MCLVVFFIFSLIVGVGMLQGKQWARSSGIIHAIIGLVSFPVGTVIGTLIIFYLGTPEISDYFNYHAVKGTHQPGLEPINANQ